MTSSKRRDKNRDGLKERPRPTASGISGTRSKVRSEAQLPPEAERWRVGVFGVLDPTELERVFAQRDLTARIASTLGELIEISESVDSIFVRASSFKEAHEIIRCCVAMGCKTRITLAGTWSSAEIVKLFAAGAANCVQEHIPSEEIAARIEPDREARLSLLSNAASILSERDPKRSLTAIEKRLFVLALKHQLLSFEDAKRFGLLNSNATDKAVHQRVDQMNKKLRANGFELANVRKVGFELLSISNFVR